MDRSNLLLKRSFVEMELPLIEDKSVYSGEVARYLQRMKMERNRCLQDVLEDVVELVQLSTTRLNRQKMITLKCLPSLLYYVRLPNQGEVMEKIQCGIIAIMANMGLDAMGSSEMTSCSGWDCVSYLHKCPLVTLLQKAKDKSGKVSLQMIQLTTAAMVNCSITIEGKLQFEHVGGMGNLLQLLLHENAEVILHAAATMWNLMKISNIQLLLETRFLVRKEQLFKQLSQILDSSCDHLQLMRQESTERGLRGILNPLDDNLTMVLAILTSGSFAKTIHLQVHDDPRLFATIQSISRISDQKKSTNVYRVDKKGNAILDICPVCCRRCNHSESLKVKRNIKVLYCSQPKCTTCYHRECSRWKILDQHKIRNQKFYCNTCYLENQVQLPDLYLQLGSQPMETLFTLQQFKRLQLRQQHNLLDAYHVPSNKLIFSPNGILLGVGKLIYSVVHQADNYDLSKTTREIDIPMVILFVTFIVHRITLMWNDQISLPRDTSWTWKNVFPGIDRNHIEHPLTVGNLVLWKQSWIRPMNPTIVDDKPLQQLESAILYEFKQHNSTDLCYSFGAPLEDTTVLDSDTSTLDIIDVSTLNLNKAPSSLHLDGANAAIPATTPKRVSKSSNKTLQHASGTTRTADHKIENMNATEAPVIPSSKASSSNNSTDQLPQVPSVKKRDTIMGSLQRRKTQAMILLASASSHFANRANSFHQKDKIHSMDTENVLWSNVHLSRVKCAKCWMDVLRSKRQSSKKPMKGKKGKKLKDSNKTR